MKTKQKCFGGISLHVCKPSGSTEESQNLPSLLHPVHCDRAQHVPSRALLDAPERVRSEEGKQRLGVIWIRPCRRPEGRRHF